MTVLQWRSSLVHLEPSALAGDTPYTYTGVEILGEDKYALW